MLTSVYLGITLGLGVTVSCAMLCVPVLVPYIGAIEYPSVKRGLWLSLLFSLGRLVAYLCLGLLLGLLAMSVTVPPLIVTAATSVLGLLLVILGLSTLGLFGVKEARDKGLCNRVLNGKSPMYLGMITGLRPCVPLIAALTYSVTLSNVSEVVLFMVSFWCGSSILIFVVGLIGGGLARIAGGWLTGERIRRISAVALVAVGVVFISQAVGMSISQFVA